MTDSEGAASSPDDNPRDIRHEGRTKPFTPPSGTSRLEEITDHVERHFGWVDRVFHEVISDLVHVDVLVVEPTVKRPWYTLVTCGMSDLPMNVPDGETCSRHAELFVQIACTVPLVKATFADEKVYWPIRRLKMLARMAHELDTFLAPGHTIASDPPEPVAEGVAFCALGVLAPLDANARTLECSDGTRIDFLQMVPMYREELEWKRGQQDGALAELLGTPALRVAVDGRPNLKGSDADVRAAAAMAAHEEQLRRGRRWLVGVAVALSAVIVAQVGIALATGVDVRWLRTVVELAVLAGLVTGDAWARWLIALHCLVGVGLGTMLLRKKGIETPLQWTVLVAIPLQALALEVLLFRRSVREYFRHCSRVRRMIAAAKKARKAEGKR